MQVFLATHNPAKIARLQKLLHPLGVETVTPQDLGLTPIEVEEGSSLKDNARAKALAYQDLTDLPILGNDDGFHLENTLLDPALVKRNALQGRDEFSMTQREIAIAIVQYYQSLRLAAHRDLPGTWESCYVLVTRNREIFREHGFRPVLFTGEVHGPIDLHFPLRSMYIVRATGKYVADQSPEDECTELLPLRNAFRKLLRHL